MIECGNFLTSVERLERGGSHNRVFFDLHIAKDHRRIFPDVIAYILFH